MNVGERITYFKNQRNLTTNKLANLTGLSQSFLRDVELSNKSITVDNLMLVCETLNISLQDFFMESKAKLSDEDILKSLQKLSSEQKQKLIEFINLL